MFNSLTTKGALAAVLVLLILLGGARYEIWRLQRDLRTITLEKVNAEAARDSTRDVTDQLRGVLAGERTAREQLMQQHALERDSIDKALKRTSKALFALGVEVKQLKAIIATRPDTTGITETADGTRIGLFPDFRKPPYTISDIRVELPPPTRPDSAVVTGKLELTITMDTVWVSGRVQCSKDDVAGDVRRATLLVTSDSMYKVSLRDLQADTEVCSKPVPPASPGRVAKNIIGGGIVGALAGGAGGAMGGKGREGAAVGGLIGVVFGILRSIFFKGGGG